LLQGPFNNDPALPVNLITLCKATGDAWGDNTLAELVNKTDNSFFFMLPRILEHGTANVLNLCLLSSATGAVLDIEDN